MSDLGDFLGPGIRPVAIIGTGADATISVLLAPELFTGITPDERAAVIDVLCDALRDAATTPMDDFDRVFLPAPDGSC